MELNQSGALRGAWPKKCPPDLPAGGQTRTEQATELLSSVVMGAPGRLKPIVWAPAAQPMPPGSRCQQAPVAPAAALPGHCGSGVSIFAF